MVLIGESQISDLEALRPHLHFLKRSYTELGTSLREYATKMDSASDGRLKNVAFPPSNTGGSSIRVGSTGAVVDGHIPKDPKAEVRTGVPENLTECHEPPSYALISNHVHVLDQILGGQDASDLKLPDEKKKNGKLGNRSIASVDPHIEVGEIIRSRLSKIY